MVYTYTPTYYSSVQDTITSLCKSILPFSLKNLSSKRLPCLTADQKLAKQQSENLKWQQEMFHQILNLIGLNKEGILPENDVSAFRSQLLDTVAASPADQEPAPIIRDKLLFLQELFYAKCISADEYHSSKRPLLLRLAVHGAEIDCRDVIVAAQTNSEERTEEQKWSVIEFKDEQSLMSKDSLSNSSEKKSKAKHRSPMKQIKGAMFKINIGSSDKQGKKWGKIAMDPVSESLCPSDPNLTSTSMNVFEPFKENPFWQIPKAQTDSQNRSILMQECSPPKTFKSEKERGRGKSKTKPFHTLFLKEQSEGKAGDSDQDHDENIVKSAKKQWGFKRWKKNSGEDESTTPYLPRGERSDDISPTPCTILERPIGEGPDTKLIKRKIHSNGSASDFFIDKVLGENIKKELSRIQTELCTANPNLNFTNDQLEAISTRLPVDKAELKKFFPKSWCDRYGDIVLDVVRKEFKDHVGEMESMRNASRERNYSWRRRGLGDENASPDLFSHNRSNNNQSSNRFANNPFHVDYEGGDETAAPYTEHNPFWNMRSRSHSSMIG